MLPQLYAFPNGLFTSPVASAGSQFFLKGINWFGFETETFSPHGLWSASMDYLLDFLQMEKFNALRVPFSTEFAENMDKLTPTSIDYVKNPDLKDKTAGQVMDILVKKCRDRGIYVMPDMHRFRGASGIPELWYNDEFPEKRVLDAWKKLVTRYKSDTTVFAADLKNEPHGPATWGSGDPKTDWAAAAERMGNALLDINPKLLIFVEGIERTKDHPNRTSWWGGSIDQIEKRPIKLKLPNRLVYSPHVYGPDVFNMPYFSKEAGFPKNLPAIWTSDFGYIRQKRLAPIVIGEWGGQNQPDSKDRVWQEAVTDYFLKNGLSCATFYWTLNPNSGDTKGVLADDWVTAVRHRLDMNQRVCPSPTVLVRPKANAMLAHMTSLEDKSLNVLRAIATPYYHFKQAWGKK